jgi:hypothetical protein
VKRFSVVLLLCLVGAAACSSSQAPKAPPPAAVPPTPTPGILSRIDPNVVEETDTYVIRRLPKDQYLKVDATHIRLPIVPKPIEFFKEDDKYYYVSSPKMPEDEKALREQQKESELPEPPSSGAPVEPVLPLSEFEPIAPPVATGRVRFEPVKSTGLPEKGMWRASFVLDDVNGDRVPDIVAPPARLGDNHLKVWIGNGKGAFAAWPLSFTEGGKPTTRFLIDYGGVAVGDIDGDGKKDIVSASHSNGLVSLFGDGRGGFRIVRAGLPGRDFSSQAIVLVDADGDGKLDIVASRDAPGEKAGSGSTVDKEQVRVYLFKGVDKGWEFNKRGLVGGFFSTSLSAWDYDGDGRKDVLTASNQFGPLTLLWKNMGDGTFAPVSFPQIETYAFHFATTPGTTGPERSAAFADAYYRVIVNPERVRANGITVYTYRNDAWSKQPVWRVKEPKGNLFALAMGDLDGDKLDDLAFVDDERQRLRILIQQAAGGFAEAAESDEPVIESPGQCLRIADLDGDGRNDFVLSTTVSSGNPAVPGGWQVLLNKR